jgi:hypothetical protein
MYYFCARKIEQEMEVWNMGLVGGLRFTPDSQVKKRP